MNTRREELQKLTKIELIPMAKSLGIKNISKMNKNFLIDYILDFEGNNFIFGGTYKSRNLGRCKPYSCKGIDLIKTDDFITCSECFSFSIKN